ncbi:MAG: glucosaminidase domain-containing protein [Candidatus Puniceispirillaceae bacterium]
MSRKIKTLSKRITHRQILALLGLLIALSYAIPTLLDIKPPRLTPKDALSPLQLKELEAKQLQQEIAQLEDRLAVLSARNKLIDEAQKLADVKSTQAQNAMENAEEEARQANEAFDKADLKEKEAKQALTYARMTERQAREALQLASQKEQQAKMALQTALKLQDEANRALKNAQTQSRLAERTLKEIEALEQKIAELNADLAQDDQDKQVTEKTDTNKSENEYAGRRLPNPGKPVLVFEDGLVPTHNQLKIPTDLDSLDVASRKERFISLLLPLIIQANDVISQRRMALKEAIATDDEQVINRFVTLYGLRKFNGTKSELHDKLLNRIAPVPASLALAQAAVESGWGHSRFAKQGNALFGQWAWRADQGIKPLDASNDRAVIRSFATIYDSVFAYMHNLNTHPAYQDFRDQRSDDISNGKAVSGLSLARYLTAYAELGQKYVYTLQSMILHNRFDIYENYQLAR